jgi:hypothetical protein
MAEPCQTHPNIASIYNKFTRIANGSLVLQYYKYGTNDTTFKSISPTFELKKENSYKTKTNKVKHK